MCRLFVVLSLFVASQALDVEKIRNELMADKNFVELRNKCLDKLGLKEEDLRDLKFDGDVSEDLMCFGKCIQEEDGLLDSEGNLNEEKLEKKIETMPFLSRVSDDTKNNIMECLKEIGKIETCQDFGKQRDCIHKYV
ncbi:odorant binding protein 4 [Tribolium castaneum]|uniref:Odorant binding protein 4 n=1 Tax=Tribolium castaneum TaxID=7070 RepID=D2A672_TRICA|nr:odorant binding protein 4 [Tribolium castaneum]